MVTTKNSGYNVNCIVKDYKDFPKNPLIELLLSNKNLNGLKPENVVYINPEVTNEYIVRYLKNEFHKDLGLKVHTDNEILDFLNKVTVIIGDVLQSEIENFPTSKDYVEHLINHGCKHLYLDNYILFKYKDNIEPDDIIEGIIDLCMDNDVTLHFTKLAKR